MKHIGIVDVTTIGACICANEIVLETNRRHLKDQHPEFSIHAFPFAEYKKLVLASEWDKLAELVAASINKLKLIGADFAILPVNTIHYAIEKIKQLSPLPVINLVEITVQECQRREFKSVVVVGTKLTMQHGLYDSSLLAHQIKPVIPADHICDEIEKLIFDQILADQINPATVSAITNAIKQLRCDAVILACTELPQVYNENILQMPAIDTTRLLAHKALDMALMD